MQRTGRSKQGTTDSREPLWRPSSGRRAGVGIPDGGEGRPLRWKRQHGGEQKGRPSDKDREDAHQVSRHALAAIIRGELKAPVEGAKERENDCSIGDLAVRGLSGVRLWLASLQAKTHISSTWCRSARAVSRSIVLLAAKAHFLRTDKGAQILLDLPPADWAWLTWRAR